MTSPYLERSGRPHDVARLEYEVGRAHRAIVGLLSAIRLNQQRAAPATLKWAVDEAQGVLENDAGILSWNITAAARDVLTERQRQVTEEGWTREHDERQSAGELSYAAQAYVASARAHAVGVPAPNAWEADWPWTEQTYKPKSERRDLVRAAALIIAEIERLDRKSHDSLIEPISGGP